MPLIDTIWRVFLKLLQKSSPVILLWFYFGFVTDMVETQEGTIGFVYSFNIFVPHKLRALLSLNTLTLISIILYINQFETVTPPSLGNPQAFEVLKIGLLKFPPPDP